MAAERKTKNIPLQQKQNTRGQRITKYFDTQQYQRHIKQILFKKITKIPMSKINQKVNKTWKKR